MILRMAAINQRAGNNVEMKRSSQGILSIGKIIPESNAVGIMSPMPDINRAIT